MLTYPIEVKALPVNQPIGLYYVTVLPAQLLLDVAFSDVLSATLSDGENIYTLDGTQRLIQVKRIQLIADYINRTDAAFPNSIIIAANYRKEDGLLEDEERDGDEDSEGDDDIDAPAIKRWTIHESPDGCFTLRIPTREKLAAIIDGQHRLFAFVNARPERLEMNLVCSVFLDLPKPFQAQLFATINSTQKAVDKSLTYELFGYNLDEEEEDYWSPDKLAVFLTRKLATDSKSPLIGKIVIAPKKDEALSQLTGNAPWKVSTAVVVEGIMRLYTSNPKKDTTLLLDGQRKKRSVLSSLRKDKSPLREAYLSNQDAVIYTMTLNFLTACNQIFWSKAGEGSFIVKTVGVQALFDILKKLAAGAYEKRNISAKYFSAKLAPAANLDFAADLFRNASGSGRSTIRNAILAEIEIEQA